MNLLSLGGKMSTSKDGVTTEAQVKSTEQSTTGMPDGAKHVVEDFYAIEKIVGWRGMQKHRQYKVRWSGLPPEEDSWVYPSDLCEDTLREAHAFVRWDNARLQALADGLEPPPSPRTAAKLKQERKEKRLAEAIQRKAALKKKASTKRKGSSTIKKVASANKKLRSSSTSKRITPSKSSKKYPDPAKKRKDDLFKSVSKLNKNSKKHKREEESDEELDPAEWARRELAKGNDTELVDFKPVKRINVNEEGAREMVTEARVNGVPVVLTGHTGWPKFASRWLKDPDSNKTTDAYQLDIPTMIRDIGKEDVPIVEKNYNEKNPTENLIRASVFLKKYWPTESGVTPKNKLYLQQWQFPNSASAAEKLQADTCCNPLPNNIFEEDLLPFWLNQGCNPYQYLFMGDAGTMSKLHNDPGGLEILIAPIVGEKECVLVHRSDGELYLYNLASRIDRIDLNRFPRTAFARVWKTVVKPGEILIMPYDTYHQCRNISPCLSYHRLHLDVVNLRGFLQSMHAGDAPELDHSEVFWNACHELMDRVDKYVERFRSRKSSRLENEQADNSDSDMDQTVRALRLFRPLCLDVIGLFQGANLFKNKALKFSPDDWVSLVQEIDHSLHEYHHRNEEKVPRFRAQRIETALVASRSHPANAETFDDSYADEEKVMYTGTWSLDKAYETLKRLLEDLPALTPEEEDLVISDSCALKPGDRVSVRLNGCLAKGKIERICNQMKAVLVTYDRLPEAFDEYHPVDEVLGGAEVPRFAAVPTPLRPTLGSGLEKQNVRCVPSGGDGKNQLASVVSTKTGTFYFVQLAIGKRKIYRWFSRDYIIRKNK